MIDLQQEHWDYELGADTDERNAFAISRANRKADDAARVREAVAAGLFVVVQEIPDLCGSTDAFIGTSSVHVVSVHATREEAEQACPDIDDDTMSFYVEPKQLRLAPAAVEADEDTPF
jgi:hypothetical protein